MQHTPIQALYSRLHASRAIFGVAHPGHPTFQAMIDAGQKATIGMIETKAQNSSDILIKLSDVLDMIREDASEAAISLLASAIVDVEESAELRPQKSAPATPAEKPKRAADRLQAIGRIKIARNCRPVVIDGVLYASMTEAACDTGLSYSTIRKIAIASNR